MLRTLNVKVKIIQKHLYLRLSRNQSCPHHSRVLQCSSAVETHSLCAHCVTVWLSSKTGGSEPVFNFKCPMYNICQSEFDPELIFDLAFQMTGNSLDDIIKAESLRIAAINSSVENDTKICCPNCPYFFSEDHKDKFFELFAKCPQCQTSFCLTCCHTLGPHGYQDHVCAATSFNSQKVRHDLEKLLTDAATFRCRTCRLSSAPITKEEGDCNVMKCTQCSVFYCYICNKNLGQDSERAHGNFPHPNQVIPHAPNCWLFDICEENKTMDKVISLRKVYRVEEYFNALEISQKEKEKIFARCSDLLGDLIHMPFRRNGFTTDKNSCKIL